MITAYTCPYNKIVDQLIVKCYLSLPSADSVESGPLDALLDTGAMSTCISTEKAAAMGLTQVGMTQVVGANNEPFNAPMYVVRVRMGKMVIPLIPVIGLPMGNNRHDVIIGMDIISRGDLAITNYEGKTVLSFREPSLERINYVDELNIQKKYKRIHDLNMKSGRADKCGCGSGRDYKNCHGRSPYLKKS